jgi:hypothetical protein
MEETPRPSAAPYSGAVRPIGCADAVEPKAPNTFREVGQTEDMIELDRAAHARRRVARAGGKRGSVGAGAYF